MTIPGCKGSCDCANSRGITARESRPFSRVKSPFNAQNSPKNASFSRRELARKASWLLFTLTTAVREILRDRA